MPSSSPESAAEACRFGSAASTQTDLAAAITEAGEGALAALDGQTADLVFVFLAAAYGAASRSAFETLGDRLAAGCLIGTTAESVLANDTEYERQPAVAVWAAHLPGASLAAFALDYAQTPDGGCFQGWPDDLAWPEDATLLLLADPFTFPVDAFLNRLAEDQPNLPVIGGMASGGNHPGSNTLVLNQQTYDAGAVGVLIGGDIRVRPLVSQGCRPIGSPLVVTRAENNMVIELGGQPAFTHLQTLYGELDEHDRELMRHSLHLGRVASEYQDHFQQGDFLVRNVLGADPETGVVAVGDQIRTGQTVQFHLRDANTATDDLQQLLHRQGRSRPEGCLVFTCNGRGSRLFSEPNHDAACLQEVLGPIPTAGFFAQGEIGPIGRQNCLHGFTASLALFGRK